MTLIFFFIHCIIKQLLDLVFLMFRIIKASVRVVTPTLTLITLEIRKPHQINVYGHI